MKLEPGTILVGAFLVDGEAAVVMEWVDLQARAFLTPDAADDLAGDLRVAAVVATISDPPELPEPDWKPE